MNAIFAALVLIAFVTAVLGEAGLPLGASVPDAAMAAVGKAVVAGAGDAVSVAISLIGIMSFFLGLMAVADAAGLVRFVGRLTRPLMHRLFPDVPPAHPAMGAMVMNISANVVGLGNAATPFGIRAMQYLATLNPRPGTATNAMVLFLAINTSNVTLIPTTVIALRAAAGSADPAGVLPTTLFATACATLAAVAGAKFFERRWPAPADGDAAAPVPVDPVPVAPEPAGDDPTSPVAGADGVLPEADTTAGAPLPVWVSWGALAAVGFLLPLVVVAGPSVGAWIIPSLIVIVLVYGLARGVPVYEAFVDGAREGFTIAVRIIPYLVAILVAVAMVKASGAMDGLIGPVGDLTEPFGVPAEALIMAALRALSGSGSLAYLVAVLQEPATGPDTYTGFLVSTIQGSTETTFYVLVVYFGAVGVRRMRHAVLTCLLADGVGLIASVAICRLTYA